ncbi:hypothetical protein COOONC_22913 [Cooperia oncophora]
MYCHEMGPVSGEMHDRQFIVVNGKTGLFYTGRQKPYMVLIDCEVHDGVLTMTHVDGRSVRVKLDEVVKTKRSCFATREAMDWIVGMMWPHSLAIGNRAFSTVILVDKAAWDEDKWLSVHIGDAALQCLQPCFRFRLAPEGPLRDEKKESPMFGVDAGIITPGYIHVGQTVYVRYKSAFRKATPYFWN